jgi:hypothetical protein
MTSTSVAIAEDGLLDHLIYLSVSDSEMIMKALM